MCVAAGLVGGTLGPAASAPRPPAVSGAGDGARSLPAESRHVERGSEATRAMGLVEAMSIALRTLDYEGTFVHLQGTHASSMHILHAYDGGGELERMVSLDGEAREVIRDHALVTCIWPGSRSVVVSKSRPRQLLPDIDAILAGNPGYAFSLAGVDRVAGVATDVVEIAPRDGYRYGYRFWIDRETRMLLRSMVLDDGRAVEQVLFTAIAYPDHVERSRFEFSAGEQRMSWLDARSASPEGEAGASGALPGTRAEFGEERYFPLLTDTSTGTVPGTFADLERRLAAGTTEEPSEEDAAVDRVRFENLPMGYAELSETYGTLPPDDAPVSHVMVSDGMASVSVYVEHVGAAFQDTSVVGLSSMGAMNAYGLSLEEGFVTVVGEVPPDTVRMIAEAVRLAD